MEGKAYPWLEVKEPTIAELAERVIIAESEAKSSKESAMAASEVAADAQQAAADAQQAAAEAGERLRMVGQLDLRIAQDVRTMRVATAVVLVCSVLIVIVLLLAWCLR